MINVVTEFGSGFKGLAAYLLHDEEHAVTDERVAWTHTHGLATDDPHKAWRIMAATAMNQTRLKAEAGIANPGRQSHKTVLHYVLSWSPEEHGEFSKEEMIDAALASMGYLGVSEGEKLGKGKAKRSQFATEHQALIVCHDEGPGKNPHIHIMICRVHPQHGILLPDSKDYEKLSAWALDYRRSQGKEHLCPQRVKNAAKRAEGILTSHRRKPRNVYLQEQAIAAAESDKKRALLQEQAQRAKELQTKKVALQTRSREAIKALRDRRRAEEQQQQDKTAKDIAARIASIRSDYADRIDELKQRQMAELEAFAAAKHSAAGYVRNVWTAFKTKQWMRDMRTDPLHALKHSFTLAFSAGLQERDIKLHHEQEQRQLRADREREERVAAREVKQEKAKAIRVIRRSYLQERNDLILSHRMAWAKLKAEWLTLGRERRIVLTSAQPGLPSIKDHFTAAARSNKPIVAEEGGGEEETVKPVPTSDAAKQRMLERLREARDERQRRRQDRGPRRGL